MTEAVQCKTPGCEEVTTVLYGRYARLCTLCRVDAALKGRKSKFERPSILPQLRLMLDVAARIEENAEKAHEVRNLLIQDITHFNKSLDEIKAGLLALIKPNNAN